MAAKDANYLGFAKEKNLQQILLYERIHVFRRTLTCKNCLVNKDQGRLKRGRTCKRKHPTCGGIRTVGDG